MANEIVIDASALESVNYDTFFSSYFNEAGRNSYLFYDGEMRMAYGRPQYMGGNQVGMTYANSEHQVVWGGSDLGYDFIHRGNGNHAITGAVDTLSFSFTTSTEYTRDAAGTSPLTGIVSDLLISNLGIDVAPGTSAAYDLAAGTGNFAHALWDILGASGTSAEAVANLYALLSSRGQHFIGTAGDDTYTGTGHDDIIETNGGNDAVDGGEGFDRFVVNGKLADFTISNNGEAGFSVAGASWTATLKGVELVVFDDGEEVNIANSPTDLAFSGDSVDENAAAGTVVGEFSAIDPNGDALFYSLAEESDFFEIDGNRLVVKAGADFETAASHDVKVVVSDAATGGNTASKTFTVTINDVNEAPTGLAVAYANAASDGKINENVKVGTVLGRLSASDVDAGDALTYSLASGSSDAFRVVGNTLVLAKALDYETQKSHTVNLVATDKDGLQTTLEVKLGVSDVTDIIKGGDANDVIRGGKGIDYLYGFNGNDTLYGGGAADKLYGNEGNDRLYGDTGNDTLEGGAGNDTLYGGTGRDVLRGGGGDDVLHGETGNDRLFGDSGHDKLYGGSGADELDGGTGDDTLYGESGNDTLTGGFGQDKLYGGSGRDLLKGGAGNDSLYGESGADQLYGGSGADTFIFVSKSESTVNANGRDTIYDFNGKAGDRIDLSDFDANDKASGNQDFDFIGSKAFSGKAGELRYEKVKGDTFVYGDTNGDSSADFSIRFDDSISFQKGYFLL